MEVTGIPDRKMDLLNPDLTKLAEAMGIPVITITGPGEVKSDLEKVFLLQFDYDSD